MVLWKVAWQLCYGPGGWDGGLIPDEADLYMMAVVFHTVLLSVMT